MQAKGWIMLRVLLNRMHKGPLDTILRYLPKEDARAVLAQEIHSSDSALALTQPEELIKNIHYSWLVTAFKKIPKVFYPPLLSLLSEEQAKSLQPHIGAEPQREQPADCVKVFFLRMLYHSLEPVDVLPVSFLPETPLTVLSTWSKKGLIELIDLLGIYDLAEEMRHIIDKNRLRQIQPCLSLKKKQFLRLCMHKPEKIATSRLGLEKWDGDCRKLNMLLHRRGLLRLGKALCSQHPDLVWHIVHILDTGRGEEILKQTSSSSIPGVTPVLVQQIIKILNFLNNSKSHRE